jgi:polar amino acid transport system substrate-binding protein
MQGGKVSGFEVELGDLIAQTLGLRSVWTTAPFDGLLAGLKSDKYDAVMASHAINSTRLKVADFARPHYCTGGVVLSAKGGPTTHRALEGLRVGAESGSTYYAYVQKLPFQKSIQVFPSSEATLQTLAFGKIDAVVTDRFAALAAVKAYPGAKLQLGEQLWQEQIGTAVAKGNSTLQSAIDGALNTLLQNGQYSALSQKYFGQDIRC